MQGSLVFHEMYLVEPDKCRYVFRIPRLTESREEQILPDVNGYLNCIKQHTVKTFLLNPFQ